MTATSALVAILVIGLLLYRQVQVRPLRDNPYRLPLILIVLGLFETVSAVQKHTPSVAHAAAAVLSLLIAAALAYPRAVSTRVFVDQNGRWSRQGTWITAVLWLVAIGGHIAVSFVIPAVMGDSSSDSLAGPTIPIFIGVGLLLQAHFLTQRIREHRQHGVPTQGVSN